jgi:hypothetical protein
MANRDSAKTHEVYTPIKTRRGLIRYKLGNGIENAKGEIEIELIGSPINGKLVVAPLSKTEPKR